jgi:hypothetical protein
VGLRVVGLRGPALGVLNVLALRVAGFAADFLKVRALRVPGLRVGVRLLLPVVLVVVRFAGLRPEGLRVRDVLAVQRVDFPRLLVRLLEGLVGIESTPGCRPYGRRCFSLARPSTW